MLRNLAKGTRLASKAPKIAGLRMFGAHAPAHLSAEEVARNKALAELQSTFLDSNKDALSYTFPNFGFDYNNLHYVDPQCQYVAADCEPFIHEPLHPSAETEEELYEKLMASAPAAYNEALNSFPDTAEGALEKKNFQEFFEPLVFQDKIVLPPGVTVDMNGPFTDTTNGTVIPPSEMGFFDTAMFSYLHGSPSTRANYALGVIVTVLSAGYICARGLYEINELFAAIEHGHDHGH